MRAAASLPVLTLEPTPQQLAAVYTTLGCMLLSQPPTITPSLLSLNINPL